MATPSDSRAGRGRSPSYTGPSYSSNTGAANQSANSTANNAAAYASLVVFRVQVGEDFGHGEDVYVCGNTPSLGLFDPHRGVQLFASTASYPFFQSAVVPLKRGEVCICVRSFVPSFHAQTQKGEMTELTNVRSETPLCSLFSIDDRF